jgi:hypothetical protein
MPAIKNNAFLLGEATLMLAPYSDATSVFDLTPAAHSIGMVRSVQVTEESDKIELRKGIKQLLVDSQKSNVRVGVSAEVFEFNAQNLYYSLSSAQTAVAPKRGKLKNAVTGPATTFIVNTDPLPGETATGISAVGDIPSGATIVLQHPTDTDYILPVKVTAATTVATNDYTVTAAVPTGMSFPIGSKCWVVNEIGLGSTADQDFFKAKIVGTLSNNGRPMAVVIPKLKIMKGFALNFDEGNYTSMPFEFDPYMLTAAEATGRLAEIGTTKMMHAYAA